MTTSDMIHQLRLELWNLSYNEWKTKILFSGYLVEFDRSHCHYLCYLVGNSRQTAVISHSLIWVVCSSREGTNGYCWFQRSPMELRHSGNTILP